jgi:hypothetical protein
MFIVVTYALTVITVGVILYFAGRQHHVKFGNSEVFRYPPVFRYLFAGAFLLFLAAGFYTTQSTPTSDAAAGERVLSWAACIAFCSLSLWGFLWTLRYAIVISGSTILVKGFLSSRSFTTQDMRSTEVRQGVRGARDLIVRDSVGHVLLKVGGTIQDFDDLLHLIRSNIPSNGSRGR